MPFYAKTEKLPTPKAAHFWATFSLDTKKNVCRIVSEHFFHILDVMVDHDYDVDAVVTTDQLY